MRTVVETEHLGREPHPHSHAVIGLVERVVDYLFGALYALLAVRLVLEFFNARSEAGFVRFIHKLSDVFYAPFEGIVATSTIGGWHLVWPLVLAILAYMLLHGLIRGLLHLAARG
jgi:hypothetical protein